MKKDISEIDISDINVYNFNMYMFFLVARYSHEGNERGVVIKGGWGGISGEFSW